MEAEQHTAPAARVCCDMEAQTPGNELKLMLALDWTPLAMASLADTWRDSTAETEGKRDPRRSDFEAPASVSVISITRFQTS